MDGCLCAIEFSPFSDLSFVSAERSRDFCIRGKGKTQRDTSQEEKCVCVCGGGGGGEGVRHMLKLGLSVSASQIATSKISACSRLNGFIMRNLSVETKVQALIFILD